MDTLILEKIAQSPLVAFTILILVVLILPPLFEKIRLPGLVGLLFAGVILGKDGLSLLNPDSESIKLLADIGKIYLMFVAGLEIDLKDFRRTKDRSLGFGIATFMFPMIAGILVGRLFGFGWNSSVLIGSLLASHTLLSYPIVQRLGVVKNEAVTVTIGATIFTDITALLVLAICVSIHQGSFTIGQLILQLVALGIYSILVLVGVGWAGKAYFQRTGDEESNQFLFVLLVMFLVSVGAQIINVDKIVGAFLAGLAINDVVGRGPVEEKIEFVGGTLFIPFFFVGMGLLIDIPAFITTVQNHFPLMIGIVGGLIGSKFIAAWVIKLIYKYNKNEGLTMWSLSIPQVAATLAAALVAYESINTQNQRLITEPVFNSVIVLMLVTSILGPILTNQHARYLTVKKEDILPEESLLSTNLEEDIYPLENVLKTELCQVVVPIYNPHTQRYLIQMSALVAKHEGGHLIPLSVVKAHVHMDAPEIQTSFQKSQKLLKQAAEMSQSLEISANPVIRIDDDIAAAISRTAREQNASLIIMGWSRSTGIRAKLFGNIIDNVFWSSHCPVAVIRLLDEPSKIHNILVPIKILNSQTLQVIKFAQLFAITNQAYITLLHVCDRRTRSEQISEFKDLLTQLVTNTNLAIKYRIKIVAHEDVAKVIIRASHTFDLVILRSMRRRTAGGLAVSDLTTEVLDKITSSVVLFGEPHS